MSNIEQCAYDRSMKRHLFMLELQTATELPSIIELRSPHFGCFIAWDADGASKDDVASLVTALLKSGGVYFSYWGHDCERVHDITDELHYRHSNSVIMTTWHNNETLDNALWFFLNSTWPDDQYEDTFRSSLAISIGSDAWATQIRAALRDPRSFSARVLTASDV
jgi:hypothetical protein